ncbi:hypothetical protein NFJ02_04g113920 [Pycnococcus provasolii]
MASWKDGVGLHVKNVYELCQCTTCYRTWNRDVNAARNIWMAFHGEYTNGTPVVPCRASVIFVYELNPSTN